MSVPPSVVVVSPYGEQGAAATTAKSGSALTWYTAEFARALRSAGCNVSVVGSRTMGATPWMDGRVRVIPSYERGHVFAGAQILKAVSRAPSDVVHVEHELFAYGGVATAFTLPLAMHRFGRPTVTTIHGVIPLDAIDRTFVETNAVKAPPRLVRGLWRELIRNVAASTDVVHVHEPEHAMWLRTQYGVRARIEVEPIGTHSAAAIDVSAARTTLQMRSSARVVLFFGNLLERKGIVPFLDSVDALLALDPEILVVVAGALPERVAGASHIMQTIEALRTRERFRYLGFVEDDAVANVFGAADVVVLPYTFSMSASGPLALAVGAGRPVLLSNAFGASYAHAPLTFKPTKEGIVDAVRVFFANSHERQQALEFVHKLGEKRTWSMFASRMIDVYASLC